MKILKNKYIGAAIVGSSGVTPLVEGKEFKLEHVQDMSLRM